METGLNAMAGYSSVTGQDYHEAESRIELPLHWCRATAMAKLSKPDKDEEEDGLD